MKLIAKCIRANGKRVTRFHTERGELMPFSAWLHAPRALLDRLTSQGSGKPWIVPAAVVYLSRVMKNDWAVFEFGSGWSTVWYAERSGKVVSIEHDKNWYKLIRQILFEHGIKNCTILLNDVKLFPKYMNNFEDNTFDLVVVDGIEEKEGDRLRCIAASVPKVKPGGYLVLDDSDRAAYKEAHALLLGWTVRRFIGVKPFPLMAVETTIYQRSLSSNQDGDAE